MLVKDLIEKLSKHDPKLPVVVSDILPGGVAPDLAHVSNAELQCKPERESNLDD